MIYAAFSVYLLGILFMAMGVYRLWAEMVRPRIVNWALLPGTVVAEMAFIFGCLITGGEVRRAKLMADGASAPRRRGRRAAKSDADAEDAEPTTEAEPKLRILGPIIAAAACLIACWAGIIIAHALLGEPVIEQFVAGEAAELSRTLPAGSDQFWDQLTGQVSLLRRMAGTCVELDWLSWRVPLFVYLALCLSIRLAPVRRPLRPTLAAIVVLAALIGLIGLAWKQFGNLVNDLWPLLTYLWTSLLLLLAVTLIIRGGVGLARALFEKTEQN